MPGRNRPIYKEVSPWPGWIQIVYWGSIIVALLAVSADGDGGSGRRLYGAASVMVVAIVLHWLVAGLTVRLYRDEMTVSLGRSGLISKRISYDDILRMEPVTYHPLREFGGWGVRFRGKRRAWTARGNRALLLSMSDGIELYIGSDRPTRLAQRIHAVGGTRIGSKGDA